MSVRRLADAALQPESFAFTEANAAWARAKMAEYPVGRQQSAVIALLWRAQEQEGWVTRAAIEEVARLLSMPYIRVLEVATFYTQFLLKPVGTKAHILVCGTTPCMLRGAEDLRAVCEHRINHEQLTTNADGTLSWEEVECLGACVNAPLVMIGNDTYEDLTVERLEEIIDAFAAGKGDTIKPGTQIDRLNSAPIGGSTTLTSEPTAERSYMPFPPPPPPAAPAGAPAPAAAAPAKPAGAPAKSAEAPAPVAAADQGPTTPGRKRQVPEESAPALKEPKRAPKVPVAQAEAERLAADDAAKADGTPNNSMREGATGAESPAGRVSRPTRVARLVDPEPVPASTGRATRERGGGIPAPAEAPQGPDDLKMIAGIGPVLERALNAYGITSFAQIAALKKREIADLEEKMKFPGRVARDEWIKQAKVLAKGGAAEYERVFGKKPR
jgi:NADH-quinone oxidoreductase subunit E